MNNFTFFPDSNFSSNLNLTPIIDRREKAKCPDEIIAIMFMILLCIIAFYVLFCFAWAMLNETCFSSFKMKRSNRNNTEIDIEMSQL